MNLRVFVHAVVLALMVLAAAARADERVLYEKPSLFGSVVVTEDDDGLRVLRFSRYGARQSLVRPGDPDYLGLAYTRTAFAGLALATEPRRILVVGLGGGTLPMFLRRHYPDATIDVVDIDPDVVDVAKRFFGFREDASMHAHVADGRRFIEQFRQPYDAILLDAYGSDNIPVHLATQEFLRAVRRALNPGGVVISNVWVSHANPLYDSMVRTYQEVFDELYILPVEGTGNIILLSLPRRQPLAANALAQLARKAAVAHGFPYDPADLVTYRFMHAQEKSQGGRVLRDADFRQAR